MKKFFITTPIYYPNARPHVGSAYTTIVCDAIARYKRMCGYDVAFLTGTDEHGEKLRRAADAAGKSPAEFVAEKRELFKTLWRTLGIGEFYDASDAAAGSSLRPENGGVKPPLPPIKRMFVHTSQNPDHVKAVQWMIRQADKAGYIEKKKYEGRYCIYDERYVSDSTEPANCDICGRPAELISEENYFFKLSAFQKPLLELYARHEKDPRFTPFVLPDFRMNEVKSFVKSGLRDISISRKRLKWGIPWPDDPEQVVYVWYDALTSYLTGIGFRGSDKPEPDFEKYWMDPETEIVHMIGKDILRFHAVYWPAFLMAAGLMPPKKLTIFAHGWVYYEQDKMSKSKGNVIYPEPIVEALNSFGAPGNDALRYYLLRDTPLGQDASFSYEGLIQRYNSDLANGLGNLFSRTLTMVRQFRGGAVPEAPIVNGQQDAFQLSNLVQTTKDLFDDWLISVAIGVTWDFLSSADGLIVAWKPWELAKSSSAADQNKLNTALYGVVHLLRVVSILLSPTLPESAQKAWARLGGDGNVEDEFLAKADSPLPQNLKIDKPEPIFPRLDKATTLARLQEFAEKDREVSENETVATVNPLVGGVTVGTSSESKAHGQESADRGYPSTGKLSEKKGSTVEQQPEQKPNPESQNPSSTGFQPVKEDTAKMAVLRTPSAHPPAPSLDQKITIDDFSKVEMRVGEVVSAERIPKADKLLKLMVDIGTEIRQVVAGIAEYYEPGKLIGMKVIVVTNLAPRKLRGVESNGMIVAASVEPDGRPVLATFVEEVPKGARLK